MRDGTRRAASAHLASLRLNQGVTATPSNLELLSSPANNEFGRGRRPSSPHRKRRLAGRRGQMPGPGSHKIIARLAFSFFPRTSELARTFRGSGRLAIQLG
jgi:hypothetical protein